jgi:uncharacterized protein (TIGR03086 family)
MTIEKSVLVPLDADQTFALLTEPERLRRWQTVSARVDLRAGGEYRWTVVPGANAAGTFVEIEPGKRLVYTWGWEGDEALSPGTSTITVTLEPAEGGTTVRLVHEGLTPEQEEAHSSGWEHFMERLAEAGREGDAGLEPWVVRDADTWDPLAAAEASLAMCSYVLRRMGPGDGKAQTPCAKYDVDQLTEHLARSLVSLGGCVGVEVTPDDDVEREARIADLAQPVLEGWRRHGLDAMVTLGGGSEFPAEMACRILSLELLVHGWDFARATGQDLPANDGLHTYVLGLAKDGLIQPAARDGDNFAAEVPLGAGADPMAQLMAYTGRQP